MPDGRAMRGVSFAPMLVTSGLVGASWPLIVKIQYEVPPNGDDERSDSPCAGNFRQRHAARSRAPISIDGFSHTT